MSIATGLRSTRFGDFGRHVLAPQEPAQADSVARRIAPVATRAWHWTLRQVQRLTTPREPQTPQELLAYARSIEHVMPNQAAELRFLAMRQPDAAD